MNILVVKLSAIGDVVHALPVSYAIKESFPDAHLTWAVEPPAYDILADNPYIDEILLFEKKKFRSLSGFARNFFPLRKRLEAGGFDVALDLQGLAKSAAIAFFSGARLRLGTANMREMSGSISRPVAGENSGGHIVERYLDVAREMGCRVDEVKFPLVISQRDSSSARELLAAEGVRDGARYAVLAPGANWPNKRWPTRFFAKIAAWLYDEKIIPVIVGSGLLDESLAADIVSQNEIPPVNLVGRTNLKELAFVIEGACLTLGGDTGSVHMAAALLSPAVMLMGPTDANRNGPYGQIHHAIEVTRPCRYCWRRLCPKKLDCLAAISPESVKTKIREILERNLSYGEDQKKNPDNR